MAKIACEGILDKLVGPASSRRGQLGELLDHLGSEVHFHSSSLETRAQAVNAVMSEHRTLDTGADFSVAASQFPTLGATDTLVIARVVLLEPSSAKTASGRSEAGVFGARRS